MKAAKLKVVWLRPFIPRYLSCDYRVFSVMSRVKTLNKRIATKVRYFFLIFFTLLSIVNASCAPISRISGYVPTEIEISQLQIGSSTKEDVVRQIGEPLNYNYSSTKFLFYVQKKVETIAFLRPRVTERKVIKLTFNKRSILSRIDFADEVDSRVFESEQNIVVSEGRKLTFWQQMFGNIGNFSSEQFLE